MFRRIGRVAVIVAALALAPAAGAQVQSYGTNDYGGFRNILPPGENGFDDLAQAGAFKAAGTYPAHASDQLGMYSSLATAVPITAADLPDGQQIRSDATNYVDGINAYISTAESPLNALTMLPAEYAAIGRPLGPQPFDVNDVVAIATLVGGTFGNGGGQQLSNASLYENLKAQFGPERRDVAGSPELIGMPHERAVAASAVPAGVLARLA
jgi:Penicillin amidase